MICTRRLQRCCHRIIVLSVHTLTPITRISSTWLVSAIHCSRVSTMILFCSFMGFGVDLQQHFLEIFNHEFFLAGTAKLVVIAVRK